MNWLRLAAAATLPVVFVTPVLLLFLKKQQAAVGNAVCALLFFMGFLIFGGIEYVDAMAYRRWCQAMNQPCPISSPSDFVRIMVFGLIAMAHIMGLFVLGDVIAERIRLRQTSQV
jgi:hypothetical protein